jgi:hypothetical protein
MQRFPHQPWILAQRQMISPPYDLQFAVDTRLGRAFSAPLVDVAREC